MVDDRYAKNQRYINSLSKWVRSDVVHHSSFDQMLCKLEPFVKEMVALDKENRAIAETEYSTTKDRQQLLQSNTWTKTKNSSKVQKNGNRWNPTKRKQTIQYESDSSNDGMTPNKVLQEQSMEQSLKSQTRKIDLQNNKFQPTPFGPKSSLGPKNMSEFFSKVPKNRETSLNSQPCNNRIGNINASNGAKNAKNKNQSPSARLASLARFSVQKTDIVVNNICSANPNFDETFEQLHSGKHPSSNFQNDNHINVPSDIKIDTKVPSDCAIPSEYTSFTSNLIPHAPLSDITPSKNDDSSQKVHSGKKKFKFSPANLGAASTTYASANVETNFDKYVVKSDTNQQIVSVNKCKTNNLNNTYTLEEPCNKTLKRNAMEECSTITSSSKWDKKLESNRYVPGSYVAKYTADSDDDFQ